MNIESVVPFFKNLGAKIKPNRGSKIFHGENSRGEITPVGSPHLDSN